MCDIECVDYTLEEGISGVKLNLALMKSNSVFETYYSRRQQT